MNKLQTNVNDIKSVAKILKNELANMSFDISHSSALNLASRSLGFKNYQTYIGSSSNNLQENMGMFSLNETDFKNFDESISEQYPRIYNQFVKIEHTQKYDIYIDRELSEDIYYYFLIFELKNNFSGRVFFSPEYNSFSLFVYKNNKSFSSYSFSIEKNGNSNFSMIKHLNLKRWMTPYLLNDTMDLIEKIEEDKKILLEIVNKYSNIQLEELYKERKND